jgi:hypothetical protein
MIFVKQSPMMSTKEVYQELEVQEMKRIENELLEVPLDIDVGLQGEGQKEERTWTCFHNKIS